MDNAVFCKAMEIARKHSDFKLLTTETWKNYLVLKQNYHATKLFTENLLAIEMKKADTYE